MISDVAAQQAMTRLGSADWALKSQVVAAAFGARDDDHFWQLLTVAAPDVVKVGPKGYIHGWIFVGAGGTGAKVHHPVHGDGTVTAHDGKRATVKFGKSTHTFEARKGTGKGGLVERAKHNANNVVTDNKHIKSLSDSELRGVDKELARRATAIGKPGEVGRSHQKVKDELKRRAAASRGGDLKRQQDERIRAATHERMQREKEITREHQRIAAEAPGAADYEKDSRQAREDVKQLDSAKPGAAAEHYDKLAEAHQRVADVEHRHDKELGRPSGYSNETAKTHEKLAEAARGEAAKARAQQEERQKQIAMRTPHAESIVAAQEKYARKSGKEKEINRAVAGHQEISRQAREAGLHDIADKHDEAAKKLLDDAAHGNLKPKKPGKEPKAGRKQKILNYVKAFTHANKLTNAAHKSGDPVAHRAAAAAHRLAAKVSLNGAQRRHHLAEVARHTIASGTA